MGCLGNKMELRSKRNGRKSRTVAFKAEEDVPKVVLGRKHALIFTQVYAFASNIEYFLVRSLRDSD